MAMTRKSKRIVLLVVVVVLLIPLPASDYPFPMPLLFRFFEWLNNFLPENF